jgi:CSLREA domain-containing protein
MSKRRESWSLGIALLAFAGFLHPLVASANIITVNSAADTTANDGVCTLREAIIAANTNTASGGMAGECVAGAAGLDTINFAILGAGVHTIQLTSALPLTTEPVIINGYSQGVASQNTLAVGNNAVLLIEIDGTNAGAVLSGLLAIGGGNSTVMGLVINNQQGGNGAALQLVGGGGGNTVTGNFLGTDPTGTIVRADLCAGLRISGPDGSNTVGGINAGDRNLIAGTGGCGNNVVASSSSDNHILNNYLGTNAAGTAALGGSSGVLILNGISTGNIVGGNTPAERNVISGNQGSGVVLAGAGISGNFVEGNFMGTDATGTLPLPNGDGVDITESAHDNMVDGNTIAFNLSAGVSVDGAPFPAGTGNAILGNSIFSNGGLGIDLGSDGVTANDHCDPDTGPNNFQNYPVITNVTSGGGSTVIDWSLDSTASTMFHVEFFSSPSCDPSGAGEGMTLIGVASGIPTGAGCVVNATTTIFSLTLAAGTVVTATATDPNTNSSEFSACAVVSSTGTPTPTNTPAGVPTNTPTNTPTTTPTIPPVPGAAVVPTLSPSMLGLLALALVGAAFFLMRRS